MLYSRFFRKFKLTWALSNLHKQTLLFRFQVAPIHIDFKNTPCRTNRTRNQQSLRRNMPYSILFCPVFFEFVPYFGFIIVSTASESLTV